MNKEVLSREMANAGISVSEMCKILGISRKSFWEKRGGKTEFKLSEVSAIMKALHRDDPRPIFLISWYLIMKLVKKQVNKKMLLVEHSETPVAFEARG